MNVHPWAGSRPHQTGADSDDKIPGLRRLAHTIHEYGSKACFQLPHAGCQAKKAHTGHTPKGNSAWWS
ncbi:MAG: hypothetical protein ACQERN_12875 [Thermodesulfobacteriota bacterium]